MRSDLLFNSEVVSFVFCLCFFLGLVGLGSWTFKRGCGVTESVFGIILHIGVQQFKFSDSCLLLVVNYRCESTSVRESVKCDFVVCLCRKP